MKKGDFSEEDKIKCLLWCNRHCCFCGKSCGTNIEIAHILPKGPRRSEDIDNAIPVCYDCHGDLGKYNPAHPKGNNYRIKEIKTRREQIYEEQTRHLVPPVHYVITQELSNEQKRRLPDVGFIIENLGDSLPVKILVATQIFLGNRLIKTFKKGHYSGKKEWNLNPRFGIRGHFTIPKKAVNSSDQLEIKVAVTIIDKYERHHQLLPVGWVYERKSQSWYLEP